MKKARQETYKWESVGDPNNPVIALIAPSNGFGGEDGQKIIQKRIDLLAARGFCVKFPQYDDGIIVVQTDVVGQDKSNRLGDSISPAADAETGAKQVIDCIKSGWNIMPLMGGDSFEKKIPLIIDYFKINPDNKRPSVKIFGFSNSTYGAILASHGICSFVSTPFTSVFIREGFEEQARELEKLMKGEAVESYPRKILTDQSGSLEELTQTHHYPLNIGPMFDQIGKNNSLLLSVEHGDWSIGLEGFLQAAKNPLPLNYPNLGNYIFD